MNLWKTFLTKFDKSSLVLRTLVICLLFLTVTSNSLVRSISISNLCASSSGKALIIDSIYRIVFWSNPFDPNLIKVSFEFIFFKNPNLVPTSSGRPI